MATVSSSGVVSGIKAGTATITASVTGGGSDACTVYVAKPDRVYYIRNSTSVNFMDGGGANIAQENLTNICQKALLTSGNDCLAQLWKVAYLGGEKYSVRPMHKQNLALSVVGTGNDVKLQDIGTTDTSSGVPNSAKWRIFYNQTGYVFQCDGNTSKTLYPSGGSAAANTEMVVSTYSTSNTAFRWYMNPTSDVTDQILIYDNKTGDCVTTPTVHVKPQETRSLSDAGIEVKFVTLSSNRQVQFTSVHPSVVSLVSGTNDLKGATPSATPATITVSASGSSTATAEFFVVCSPYRINLDVQYDGGYVTRFAQSSLTAVQRINAHMPELWKFYLETSGVEVVASTPEQFESLADKCTSKGGIDELCSCGHCEQSVSYESGTIVTKTIHHTNVYNVVLREVQTPLTNRRMLFTGHRLCELNMLYSCDDVGSYGISWIEHKISAVYSHEDDTSKPQRTMNDELFTVLHEFGHLIGAEDHYGQGYPTTGQMNGGNSQGPYNEMCIYGEDREELSTPTICQGCSQVIQAYLSNNYT